EVRQEDEGQREHELPSPRSHDGRQILWIDVAPPLFRERQLGHVHDASGISGPHTPRHGSEDGPNANQRRQHRGGDQQSLHNEHDSANVESRHNHNKKTIARLTKPQKMFGAYAAARLLASSCVFLNASISSCRISSSFAIRIVPCLTIALIT